MSSGQSVISANSFPIPSDSSFLSAALSAVFHYASTPHGNTLAPDPGTSYTTVPAPDARIAFPTTMDIAIIAGEPA